MSQRDHLVEYVNTISCTVWFVLSGSFEDTGWPRSKRKSVLLFTYICIVKVAWLFAVTYGAQSMYIFRAFQISYEVGGGL